MKFTNQATTLFGIKSSQGDYEGKAFSSTTFHLPADIAASGSGEAVGMVTTPYKFGDANEIKKWAHLKNSWPVGGLPVLCDFDVIEGKDSMGRSAAKLVLLGIKPAQAQKAA